jgi:hypothetical protein
VHRSIFLAWLAVACSTAHPREESVMLEPMPAPTETSPAAALAPPPPAAGGLLNEALQPVRGGQRVLPPYRGPQPCQMALLGESPVAKACSDAGVRGAVDLMQRFVRRAREQGIMFECTDCHPVEDEYSKLAPQADLEFRKLLFLARPD